MIESFRFRLDPTNSLEERTRVIRRMFDVLHDQLEQRPMLLQYIVPAFLGTLIMLKIQEQCAATLSETELLAHLRELVTEFEHTSGITIGFIKDTSTEQDA